MNHSGTQILIVDDNEAIRRVTRSVLERAGHVVLDAEDGEMAVELFREVHASIGLILLDLSMPGIDGVETLHLLRTINSVIPVVMMSGYDEPISLTAAEGLAFLQKPFMPAELRDLVAELLPPAKEQAG